MTLGAETAGRSGARAFDPSVLVAVCRKHAPALAAALAVNLVLVGLVAFTTRARSVPDNPPLEVFLVAPPLIEQAGKPSALSSLAYARPRAAVILPGAPPPEVKPLPLPPAVSAPPSRWTLSSETKAKPFLGDLDRAVVPDIRLNRDCASGKQMTPSEREACDRRLAMFKPNGTPKPAFPLKDPDGEWETAARRQEDRRKPMTQAPVHDCHTDNALNNLASGCTN